MDSIKTKQSEYYKTPESKCYAGIAIVPEAGKLRIYVAWEWESQAQRQVFSVIKSRELHDVVDNKVIDMVANKGQEVYDKAEIKKIMNWLF